MQTVTIYGASSSNLDVVYVKTAGQLGELLALKGFTCINGAGKEGLMGAVTNGALRAGGKVIGIIPQFMMDAGWSHPGLTEIIITPDMHTRKRMMAEQSDACIALPGGIGTLEELLEIITWKQLGLYAEPVVILNINHYYDDLLAMLNRAVNENFMRDQHVQMWSVAFSPEEALEQISITKDRCRNPHLTATI